MLVHLVVQIGGGIKENNFLGKGIKIKYFTLMIALNNKGVRGSVLFMKNQILNIQMTISTLCNIN